MIAFLGYAVITQGINITKTLKEDKKFITWAHVTNDRAEIFKKLKDNPMSVFTLTNPIKDGFWRITNYRHKYLIESFEDSSTHNLYLAFAWDGDKWKGIKIWELKFNAKSNFYALDWVVTFDGPWFSEIVALDVANKNAFGVTRRFRAAWYEREILKLVAPGEWKVVEKKRVPPFPKHGD